MVAPSALLLTHGAGGDSSHRLLVAMEMAEEMKVDADRIAFAGRSMGGRICSIGDR